MLATVLLAVPNVSEGREAARIERLAAAFTPARLLDVHSDRDHNRSVFTLAGEQGPNLLVMCRPRGMLPNGRTFKRLICLDHPNAPEFKFQALADHFENSMPHRFRRFGFRR